MISKFALILSVPSNKSDQESVALFNHLLMFFRPDILILRLIFNKVQCVFEHCEIHHQPLILFVFLTSNVKEHNIILVF